MKLENIDKHTLFHHLKTSTGIMDLSRKISFRLKPRNVIQLNKKFNIDIRKVLNDNLNRQLQKQKEDFLNKIVICDNCGR